MSWWPEAPASDLLSNPRLVVPVVGAGLSIAAGLPGAAELANYLGNASGLPAPAAGWSENLFIVADTVYGHQGIAREALNQAIASRLDLTSRPDVTPTGAHLALARIPSRLIVTFNYDLLIEEAAQQQNIEYSSITHRDSEALVEHLRARRRRRLLVYHIHGSIAEPSSIVIDDASYRAISNDMRVIRTLEYLADFTSLCFLGSRLDEPHIQATLLRLPSMQPRHVLVTDEVTAIDLTTRRAALIPTRYGIVTAFFQTGRWDLIEEFANRLVTPKPISKVPRTRDARQPYRTFIEPKIRLVNGDAVTEIASLISSLFTSPEHLGLWDIVHSRRALMVGSAGIGKTSLLYRLAETSDELENPIIVALSRVSHLRGTPETVLSEWLTDKASTPPSARKRESGRMVIMLDGLDEVDHNLQAQAAETIASLAEAFPQHRFVVASRRVPALTILTSQGFTEFEVETDRHWAEEFLHTRGRSLSWLKEALPEISLLGPLSSNPFVLTTLYRLAEQAAPLKQLDFSRTCAFIDHLVQRLIDREAHRMAYSSEVLHAIVRELAVVQRLFGLKSVDLRTIDDNSDALRVFGSVSRVNVLHDAARRCLIWTDGHEYSFAEPLICDRLTAAYLLGRDPNADTFTDAIAPPVALKRAFSFPDKDDIRTDIDQPRKVRSDLVGIAGMLASHSHEWALWLWSVDPALVAISLNPQDQILPASERADLLWRRAISERGKTGSGSVGISSSVETKKFGGHSNLQWMPDEISVLQALLQAEGAGSTADSIYHALVNDTVPVSVRAVAATALTFAEALTDIELERLLETSPRMLLAPLATVARKRRLFNLISVIGKRVLSFRPDDPVVDELLEEIHNLSVVAGNARAILSLIMEVPPMPDYPAYWKLFGIARMNAQAAEFVDLWKVALRHRAEFLEYFSARPVVAAALGHQLIRANEAGIFLSESLAQEVNHLMNSINPESSGAKRINKIIQPKSERDATASPRGASDSRSSSEADNSRPVFFPRLELTGLVRSIVFNVGMDEAVDYSSWLPPEIVRQREALQTRDATDPLAEVDRRISEVNGAPSLWHEWLPSVLPPGRQLGHLSPAIRAAIGARVEAAIDVIRPGGADVEARLRFLTEYGQNLRLEPSPDEWIALARRNRDHYFSDWLRVSAPSVDFIHRAFSGITAREICNLLSAVPAGMRSWFATDVADALTAVGILTDKELATVAREFADAGDISSVRTLISRFPDRLAAFAGWAAACGDSSNLTFLLNQMVSDANRQEFEDYLSWRLDWIEAAASQDLEWPEETSKLLMIVILNAVARLRADRRYTAIVEAVGTLLCSVAPDNAVVYCEMSKVTLGWRDLKKPFDTLFSHAIDRTRIAVGVKVARELLSANDLRGRRAIVLYEPRL